MGGLGLALLLQIIQIKKPYKVKLDSPCAYTKKEAFIQGELITLYVHSKLPYRLDVIKLAEKMETCLSIENQAAKVQSVYFHPRQGFDWEKTNEIDTDHLALGYYLIKVTNW